MKLPLLLALACLGFCSVAGANDSAVTGAGGRWKRLGGEPTTVQMVSEKIRLDLDRDDSCVTTAEFVFSNSGPATSVKMGFPERGYGDIIGSKYTTKPGFVGFATWIDGQATRVVRQRAETDEMTYSAYWVKTVPFGKGQNRRVKVSYRSPYGVMATPIGTFALYDFTGGNWKGKVATSELTVHLSRPGAYLVESKAEKTKAQFARRGQDFICTWHNWQAEDNFCFTFARTVPDWLAWPDEDPIQEGYLPVKIAGDAKGLAPDWFPGGFVRNGQTYVNVEDWESKMILKGEVKVEQSARKVHITSGKRTADYPLPGSAIVLRNGEMKGLYLPVSALQKDLGAKFRVDLKTHRIEALKAE